VTFSIWRSLFIPLLTLGLVASIAINVESAGAATPNAPTGVTATYLSASSATVSWTAPSPVSGVTITGYVVTSSPGSLTCALAASASTLSCLELGLTAGTSYTFGVAAWSAGGTGPSASSSAATSPSLSTTTTTLVASQISSGNLGSTVTLTAYVPSGATGTVNFRSGGSSIVGCGSEVVTSGFATCTTKSLATGTDSLTAVYSGDSNYQSSTSLAINFTISSTTLLQPTSPLVVTSTASPFNTMLALVTSGGSGSGAMTYTVINGTATGCSISGVDLSVPTNVSGTCLVTATQASDSTYLGQSSNVTTVNFFWNYATYPSSYLYCTAGDTLSGDTCTHLSYTYAAYDYDGWSCPSGWSPATGDDICSRVAYISHAACTADGGTWLGSSCELTTEGTYGPDGGAFGDYCSYGAVQVLSTCYVYTTYTAYVGTAYSCPYGGTLTGLNCALSGGSGPNLRSIIRPGRTSEAPRQPPSSAKRSPKREGRRSPERRFRLTPLAILKETP
jgi:hypothetical protein